MKLFFSLLGVAVVIFVLASIFNKEDAEVASVNTVRGQVVSEVLSEVEAGTANILDVRTKVEFDIGHIGPANLFNVEWLKAGQLPEIDKNERVYVYCHSGSRSAAAKEILEANGWTDVVDLGGYPEWEEAGGVLAATSLPPSATLLEQANAKPIPVLGDRDAKLTMVKYSDYMCPFCANYTVETEPEIISKYVETGLIKYEFRNVAFQGDESAYAAIGGYCANEQDAFWDYQYELAKAYMQMTRDEFDAMLDITPLTDFAASIKLDKKTFNDCVTSGKYDDVVTSETLEAKQDGIGGTPFFVVGDQTINGALPLNIFEATIDAQL